MKEKKIYVIIIFIKVNNTFSSAFFVSFGVMKMCSVP